MTTKAQTEKIDHKAIEKTHVAFSDMNSLVKALLGSNKVRSWGAHGWLRMNPAVLRFMVQARRHFGHVYISPNVHDLFDVWLTTTHGRIVKHFEDIHVEDLVPTIDDEIENIADYKR